MKLLMVMSWRSMVGDEEESEEEGREVGDEDHLARGINWSGTG